MTQYNKMAIDFHEYRLGIIVLDVAPYDKIYKLDIGMLINAVNGIPYRPIPLTPEWLERCGFEYKEPFYIKRPLSISKNFFRDASGNYDGFVLRHKFEDCMQVLVIKYLHQLQNLYFALTGEELKIEL